MFMLLDAWFGMYFWGSDAGLAACGGGVIEKRSEWWKGFVWTSKRFCWSHRERHAVSDVGRSGWW